MKQETIEGLRESNRKDLEAARVLDCAAVYVDRGWAQCTDAVSSRGVKVPAHSRRATCWCMLGAIRAAMVRLGLWRLVDQAAFTCPVAKSNGPFCDSVYERALWATARAILGREPKTHAHTPTIVTQWNDTTALSGQSVARKLRDAAGLVRLRSAAVERGLAQEDAS